MDQNDDNTFSFNGQNFFLDFSIASTFAPEDKLFVEGHDQQKTRDNATQGATESNFSPVFDMNSPNIGATPGG